MTRLISGRVEKIDSANVSADRYQYLRLEEAEPDLGLPSSLGQVFTSNLTGVRSWITLNTADINETSNLYYGNDRVRAFIEGNIFSQDIILRSNLEIYGDLVVQGNTVSLNTATLIVEDKNIILANGAINSASADGAGITIDGAQANLIYKASSDRFVFNKTIEANVAGTVTQLINHTTSNLLEGNNLYFTNTRAILALDNSNVNIGNLFVGDIISGNTLVIRGINVADDALLGNVLVTGITGNTLRIEDIFAVDIRVDSITSNTWNRLYSSNVIETDNLYYTNARVDSRIAELSINVFSDVDITNVSNDSVLIYDANSNTFVPSDLVKATASDVANIVLTLDNFTTSNVAEGDNLYYTNSRVLSAVNPLLVTSNVIEGNNLYYTNSRVTAHIAASDIETLNLTVDGNLIVVGNLSYLQVQNLEIADNMVYLNANSNISNPDLGWSGNYNDGTYAHTGVFRDASDGIFKFFEGYTPEPDESAYINVAHESFRFANVQAENFIGKISTLSNHTTSNLIEGSRLYYTNARVDSRVSELSINVLTDVDITNITNGQILVWNSSSNTFIVSSPDTAQAANVAQFALLANVSNTVLTLSNFDTDDLSEGNNLYYTNARVYANLLQTSVSVHKDIDIDVSLLQEDDILIWDGTKFVAQQVNAAVAANVAEYVLSLSLNDTDDLQEGNTNLYFTEERVVSALTPGRGISISQTGIISSVDDSADFNLLLDGGVGKFISNTMSNVLVFPSPASTSDRFILRSIQITNASDEDISVSGNLTMTGNTATFANRVPIPVGGSIEFLKRAQAFNRNDSISMIGFDANSNPAPNLATVSFSYETVPTTGGLFSTGKHISAGNVNHVLYDFQNTYGVLESIKLVNIDDSDQTRARVIWANSNNNIVSYFAYNLALPQNSSIEVLSATKRLNSGDKILVRTNSNTKISAIISGRLGDVTQILEFPTSIVSGQSSSVYWETDVADGTSIYYSIE